MFRKEFDNINEVRSLVPSHVHIIAIATKVSR